MWYGVSEALDLLVDVPVIEPAHNLFLEDLIDPAEIDNLPRQGVNGAAEGSLELVVVAVPMGIVAGAKDFTVLLFGPVLAVVAMSCAEPGFASDFD